MHKRNKNMIILEKEKSENKNEITNLENEQWRSVDLARPSHLTYTCTKPIIMAYSDNQTNQIVEFFQYQRGHVRRNKMPRPLKGSPPTVFCLGSSQLGCPAAPKNLKVKKHRPTDY